MNTYRHLCLSERQLLELHVLSGKSNREIARELGRPHSTILRERRRNAHPLPGVNRLMSWQERAKDRNDRAKARQSKKRSKKRKLLKNRRLLHYVIGRLFQRWSPEQISGRLSSRYPRYKITAKTIYNYIKYERQDLKEYLRRHGKPYRQMVTNRRGRFQQASPEKRGIDERPLEVLTREDFGHWEGDTVVSRRGGKGGVLSLIERKSRERFFFILPDLKAESVIRVLLPFFQKQPEHMRKSLTLDNGSEFAPSEILKLELVFKNRFKVFYCHPYKSQEKGSVENSNGWLRGYYPKGTDFSIVGSEELSKVQCRLNNRPMKLHCWRSSSEVFREALNLRKAA